ncbi:MAG: hypothetical protein O2955_11010 [Planctomycetota bacterium]|nr:hypothetical protein [Planctomycetota bacterium]
MRTVRWTDEQFDEMSWHDNHVYSLRIVEGEFGTGELVLDLDYICEWIQGTEKFQFRIVPATLRFFGVWDLRISLSYADVKAAMGPFSINGIERMTIDRERYIAHLWTIPINLRSGEISFEAQGFEQLSYGSEVLSFNQRLFPHERQIT